MLVASGSQATERGPVSHDISILICALFKKALVKNRKLAALPAAEAVANRLFIIS